MKQKAIILLSLLLILSNTIESLAQYSSKISLVPFKNGTREDSLKVTSERISLLIEARRVYELSYMKKDLVFVPIEGVLLNTKPFLLTSNIDKFILPNHRNEVLKIINRFSHLLKKSIGKTNREIRKRNREIKRDERNNLANQFVIKEIKRKSDFELILVPIELFIEIDKKDPRENKIDLVTGKTLEQILLGKPYDLAGYVNSLNYTDIKIDGAIPTLIKNLLDQNLELSKKLIRNPQSRSLVSNVKLTTQELNVENKFWINIVDNEIYFSPFLVRALFNISYYQVELLELAEKENEIGRLPVFLRGKGGSSMVEINNEYFDKFVNIFSKNIQFIIGHELAHLYTKTAPQETIELACDCNSANNLIMSMGTFDLGIFQKFIVNSIDSNEIGFWGEKINIESLKYRFQVMKKIETSKTIVKECIEFIKSDNGK